MRGSPKTKRSIRRPILDGSIASAKAASWMPPQHETPDGTGSPVDRKASADSAYSVARPYRAYDEKLKKKKRWEQNR